MKKFSIILSFLYVGAFGQTPCQDGKAGDYDCLGIDLQSNISAPDLGAEEWQGYWVNDIWGWVDPETNKEYALVGMTNGTSFVDVSDPINPIVLGVLYEHNAQNSSNQTLHDGAKSIWRDIKVYNNHAFMVSEDPGHGMQVFDLADLRDVMNPPVTFSEAGHYSGIGDAHNIVINEETGFAYIVGYRANEGKDCSNGGLHIVDISDPTNPVFAGCFDNDGYTHDAQCVIYNGPDTDYQGKEICFNSNEEDVVIVDVTDKENITMLSKNGYEDARYVHQGWLTEDHRYFLSNDELDERDFSRQTRTFIWNVEDLDAPQLLGFYEHDTRSIDHNLYIHGKYVFESNYTTGLRILDTVGISSGNLKEVAFFDTFVSSNTSSFEGNWSNYPYFPSGNIIASDITNGLFVLKMQSFFIAEQPENVVACVGEHLDIPVSAVGDDLTYQWQIDEGDGFKNIDDFERYKNTQTSVMHAHTLNVSQNDNQYRCIITEGESEIVSNAMTLAVLDSPKASFSYGFSSLDGTIIFNNTSQSAETYEWNFGDEATSEEESPTHQYLEEGLYEIMLIATNGCTQDTAFQTLELVITALDDLQNEITVYPTTASNQLTIESENSGGFNVEIYSLNGRKILKQKVEEQKETISLHSLSEGIYLVKIDLGGKMISRKIVVER